MEVIKNFIKLKVPHEKGTLTFQYPSFKGTYGSVAGEIDKEGLKRPNSKETASLVYDAWKNPEGAYESEIIKILKDAWLWEYTRNWYLPKSSEEVNDGVIIEHNSKRENGKLVMDKSSLIKRLQENDPLVKFVPFGYKIGEQNTLELMKNPYIIARYGEEGADKIAEVSSKYKENPFVYSFNSVNEEKSRMSALDNDWGVGGLDVNGDVLLVAGVGRAFGVKHYKVGESEKSEDEFYTFT